MLDAFGRRDYRIYVGCYPNDPATAAAVAAVDDPRVRIVVGPSAGPTSKADCLNRLWQRMIADEAAEGFRFKAVVLHDAEDIVHSAELPLFDSLIEQYDLVQLPVVPAYGESVWHQFTLLHPRRDELRAYLEKNGIGTEIIYPGPMHRQQCYAHLGYAAGSLPVAEKTSATCVSLPIFPELTDEQVDYVIAQINAF